MADLAYPLALSPVKIGAQVLKNRIYFAPMGIDLADQGGTASAEMIDFYRGIIDGGCGMVILGNASIDPSTRLQTRGLGLHNEAQARALAPLLDYGRSQNCPVVVQLQHYGAQGSASSSAAPQLSPSGVPCSRMMRADPNYRCVAMSYDDIIMVKQKFVRAARFAQLAGADLVQLQASNGYLLSSFLSPHTNRRDDAYGGDAQRRMRLLTEVLTEIRDAVPGLQVSVRLGIDDCLPEAEGGQRPALLAPFIGQLEAAGMASMSCSMSVGATFGAMLSYSHSSARRLHDGVRIMRRATRVPLGFAGFVGSVAEAEQIMRDVGVDLVGMTRALFADNDLVRKAQSGEGALRACRFDGNCFRDKGNPRLDRVYCCVNPKYLRPADVVYS